MAQACLDNVISGLLNKKYKSPEKTKEDILLALKHFKGLVVRSGVYVFASGKGLELASLDGTIPVTFKSAEYNIPVCIWILDSYPLDAPMCYVRPTKDMMIKVSKNVDQFGKIYLPYLHDWHYSKCDLVSLIQVLISVFQESSPVFAVPMGGGRVMNPHQTYPSPSMVPFTFHTPMVNPNTFQTPVASPNTFQTPMASPNTFQTPMDNSNTCPYPSAVTLPSDNDTNNVIAQLDKVSTSENASGNKDQDPDDIYPMIPGKIGQCLIINNVDFQHEDFQQREGSDIDARRFEDLFAGFGFIVTVKRNLTAQKMRSSIWDVARLKENEDCSAFVLIVLTHGDEGLLCGTDYKPEQDTTEQKTLTCFTAVTYKEIVRLLDNNNSRYLRNKPKICFIQACNGVKRSEIAEEGNVGPANKKYMITRLPEASDILLSFAAQEGYSTFRKTDTGGIYAYHLANVLVEKAAYCDLQEMLAVVERRIRSDIIKVYDKEKQKHVEVCLSTSVKLLGWSRKFYFPSERDETS